MENLINQEIIFELSDINKTLVCRDNKENIWFIYILSQMLKNKLLYNI